MLPLRERKATRLLCARKRKRTISYLSSAINEDIMVTLDVSSQLHSHQPIVDVTIAGLSRSSFDPEHTGEHHADPHGQFDII